MHTAAYGRSAHGCVAPPKTPPTCHACLNTGWGFRRNTNGKSEENRHLGSTKWLASSPGLRILWRWKMKAWYTLFVHVYNFNQNSVKPFISKQIRVLFTSLSRSGQQHLLFVLCRRSRLHPNGSPTLSKHCVWRISHWQNSYDHWWRLFMVEISTANEMDGSSLCC